MLFFSDQEFNFTFFFFKCLTLWLNFIKRFYFKIYFIN